MSWLSVVAWELSFDVVCGARFALPRDSWLSPASAAMLLTLGTCWEAVSALVRSWSIALSSMPVAVAYGLERGAALSRGLVMRVA